MNFATLWASAKLKIAVALAALIALVIALWEAYSKGRTNTLNQVKAGEADDLRETLNTVTDVNDLIRARPPNLAVNDIKPTVPAPLTLGEGTNTPADLPGAVRLDQASPDSSAGRLNILAENNP